MRIVFGWNSFKIKSFTPEELGISNETKANIKFEVRQKYFHLFWIPTFGIGKEYAVRKDDGLYEMPLQYKEHLKQTAKIKTPWYTFALPLLLITGFSIYVVNDMYEGYRRNARADVHHAKEIQTLEKRITTLDTTEYLKLVQVRRVDGNRRFLIAKIEEQQGDRFTVSAVEVEDVEYKESNELREMYMDSSAVHQKLVFNRKDLAAAIVRNRDSLEYGSYQGVDLFHNGEKYILREIEYFTKPVIEMSGTGGYNSDHTISMGIYCFGPEATLLEIKNLEGEMKWTTELPMELRPDHDGGMFGANNSIRAENYNYDDPYKFILKVKDRQGRIVNYLVEGSNLSSTTQRID